MYACSLSSTHVETSPTTFMTWYSLSTIVSLSLGNLEGLESSEIGADSGAAGCVGVDISTISPCGPYGWPSDVGIVGTWDGMLLARRDDEGGHQRGHRNRHDRA